MLAVRREGPDGGKVAGVEGDLVNEEVVAVEPRRIGYFAAEDPGEFVQLPRVAVVRRLEGEAVDSFAETKRSRLFVHVLQENGA